MDCGAIVVHKERSYEYDELERLISETVTVGDEVAVTTYTYDSNSNRVSMDRDGEVTVYEYNELGQLVSAGGIEYTWDNAGNLVSQSNNGTIVASYTYDCHNRMLTASVNTSSGMLEQSYTYDYLGNRTSKTTDGVTVEYTTDLSTVYSQILKKTTDSTHEALSLSQEEQGTILLITSMTAECQ